MVDLLTARMGVTKPNGNDTFDVTTYLDAAYDKLDLASGFVVCTSTTRPSAPYQGMAIHETNTGNRYVYVGAAWVTLAQTQAPPFTICTSTTRPAGVSGLGIYETDTGNSYIYTGSAWAPLGVRVVATSDATAGLRNGERRTVIHGTYGWIEERWSTTDSKWHGINNIEINGAWANGSSNISLGANAEVVMFNAALADPGYPYYVRTSMYILGSNPSASEYSLCRARLGSLTGTQISLAEVSGNAAALSASGWLPTHTYSTILNGAQTVVGTAAFGQATSSLYADVTSGTTFMNVTIIPA